MRLMARAFGRGISLGVVNRVAAAAKASVFGKIGVDRQIVPACAKSLPIGERSVSFERSPHRGGRNEQKSGTAQFGGPIVADDEIFTHSRTVAERRANARAALRATACATAITAKHVRITNHWFNSFFSRSTMRFSV